MGARWVERGRTGGGHGDVQQRGGEEEREVVASPALQRRGSARLDGAFGEEDGDDGDVEEDVRRGVEEEDGRALREAAPTTAGSCGVEVGG